MTPMRKGTKRRAEVMRPFSVQVDAPTLKLIREEAARRRIPMTQLIREWIDPHLDKLRRRDAESI